MTAIERYRLLYDHECDCNDKMLAMIESVPADVRSDPRFQRAVNLAAHLAACRENWLDRMTAGGEDQVDWVYERAELDTLRPRYARLQQQWTEYLSSLEDKDLSSDFDFPGGDGSVYRWNIEGQILQLVGHAAYHRGQVALLVDDLGGETVDTDYLYWAISQNDRWGKLKTDPFPPQP